MPHDHDEKPAPAPEPPAAFDFNDLPRVRPKFFLTPDEPPGKPAPQKPTPGQAGEPAPEFDPDILPRVASARAPGQAAHGGRRAGESRRCRHVVHPS